MRAVILAGLLVAPAPGAAQHGSQHAAQPAAEQEHSDAAVEDRAAVLAVVDQLFGALATRNSAALLAAVVPEGRATSSRMQPTRGFRSRLWAEFAAGLAGGTERLSERLIDPHVHVEGDIAMIWSRYEFEVDGRFAHCGIDHFDLVRQDGRWRVLNLTWTQQTVGCPGR